MFIKDLIDFYDCHKDEIGDFYVIKEKIGVCVNIDEHGNFLGIIKYQKNEEILANVFLDKVRTRNIYPLKLYDKKEYVFGNVKDIDDGKNISEKNESFVKLVKNLSDVYPDNSDFNAVKQFYFDNSKNGFERLLSCSYDKIKGIKDEYISFRINDSPFFVCDVIHNKELLEYSKNNIERAYGTCMITGETGNILIKNFPALKYNGESNVSLSSFNGNSSCESWGLKNLSNAPVSVESAYKSIKVLRYMMENKKYNCRVYNDSDIYIYWKDFDDSESEEYGIMKCIMNDYKKQNKSEKENKSESEGYDDIMKCIMNDFKNDEEITNIIKNVFNGKKSISTDTNMHFLIINNNRARFVIKNYIVCPVSEFLTNIYDFFDNIKISANYKKKNIGILNISDSLITDKSSKNEDYNKKEYVYDLFLSAITGKIVSMNIMKRANQYIKKFYRLSPNDRHNYKKIYSGIIRLFLNRNKKLNIKNMLDEQLKNEAYLLGRLLAVYVRIECVSKEEPSDGKDKTNTVSKENGEEKQYSKSVISVIEKNHFQYMMTRPLSEYGKIRNDVTTYMNKLKKTSKGTGFLIMCNKIISDIQSMMVNVPSRFSPVDQSMFALGYDMQMNKFFESKDNKVK